MPTPARANGGRTRAARTNGARANAAGHDATFYGERQTSGADPSVINMAPTMKRTRYRFWAILRGNSAASFADRNFLQKLGRRHFLSRAAPRFLRRT